MRRVLFLSVFLILSAAAGQESTPLSLHGTYVFSGTLQNSLVRDNVQVYAFTTVGRQQLQDLRARSYTCANTGREIYLCRKLETGDLPDSVAEKLRENRRDFQLSFADAEGSPSLSIQGTDFSEWEIPQSVRIGSRTFSKYRYQILGGKLHKIALDEAGAAEAEYLVVSSAERLLYGYQWRESLGKNAYREYIGWLQLDRVIP